MSKRIVVVGGGPGGYSAALSAARLGAEVVLAESAKIGGTCLNVGCVPTKSLLHIAGFYRSAMLGSVPGVRITGAELDWQAALSSKDATVARLTGAVSVMLRRSGVNVLNETASLLPNNKVRVGAETISADAVILATGSVSAALSFPGADLPGVIGSTEALSLDRVPKSMVIIGGGVIGVEFASLFASLGSEITIIELAGRLLPAMDAEVSEYMQESLEADGIAVNPNARILSAKSAEGQLDVSFIKDDKELSVSADALLVAAGRKPNTEGLDLKRIGVEMNGDAIETDGYFMTNIPGIYAVGDCNGKAMLAHAAMAQGETAAERAMGVEAGINHRTVPSCVYSLPEVSSVGLTEEQVRSIGMDYNVGRFSLSGNARAAIEGGGGFIKILSDKKYGEILGAHIVGPYATELIAEAALCLNMEGTVDDIANTIHAHPTVGESFRDAVMGIQPGSI